MVPLNQVVRGFEGDKYLILMGWYDPFTLATARGIVGL